MTNHIPLAITGDQYHRYHNATVKKSTDNRESCGLIFTHYVHPKHCRGAPRPATMDHILAFGSGGAVKGENAINSDKWRPYVWREEEWFMGPAFGNDRDSCWDTLCAEDEDLNVCYLHLSPDLLKRAAEQVGYSSPNTIELPNKMGFKDPMMYQLGLSIKQEVEQNSPFGRLYMETAANMLAIHLIKNYCQLQAGENLDHGRIHRLNHTFRKVIDHIDHHLNDDLSLKELSNLANMSEFHFARQFKETFGVPPHQYVVKAKMKKACSLLTQSATPIAVIANELGYSYSYFVQNFKKIHGVTPAAFRKRGK